MFAELEKSKDNSKDIEDATKELRKQLHIEKTLKTQAVNKLAEIMNRKDLMQNASRKRKATSDDLRKKEKECRKLHQELGAVSTLIKDGAMASDCSECKRRKTENKEITTANKKKGKYP